MEIENRRSHYTTDLGRLHGNGPAGEFLGPIQQRYLRLVEDNLPVADAFFNELRNDGYFVALSTRDTILMMVNLLVGTTYTWVLTGEGRLEHQAVSYMEVLVRGLRAGDA